MSEMIELVKEEYEKLHGEGPSNIGKIIGAIYVNLPNHPENYNHPETGRKTYIYGIAYESAQLRKCASTVIQEIINQYTSNGNVINVQDLLVLIEELK